MPTNTEDTQNTATREALKPAENGRLPLPGEQVTLTDSERSALYSELIGYWNECAWPAAEVAQRAKDWRDYNCAVPVVAKKWPITTFDGQGHSADIHLPGVRAFVDAWVAQVSESIFAERPLIAVQPGWADTAPPSDPENPPDPERADRAESYYDYFYEAIAKYPRFADEFHLRVGVEGVGVAHIPYINEKRRLLRRAQTDGTGAMVQESELKPVYDGPKPEVVPLDNFRVYPSNSPSVTDAYAVFHETHITRRELEKLRKAGKAIISDDHWKGMAEGDEKPVAAENEGKEGSETYKGQFKVVYAWMPYENGKGAEPIDHVFAFLPEHDGVLYSVTPCNTGDVRPFVTGKARKTGKRLMGLPIPRILDHCLATVNTNVNQMLDRASLKHYLAQSPFFTPDMEFDLNEPWLGRPVPVAAQGQVHYLDIGADMEALPRIQFFLDMAKELTGINSNQLGVQMPGGKTATEVDSINTQGSKIYREQIEMLAQAHVEIAELIAWQLYLNGPETIPYPVRVTQAEQDAMAAQWEAEQQAQQAMPTDLMDPMGPEQTAMDLMGANVPPPPPSPALGDSGAGMGLPAQAPPPPPKWRMESVSAQDFAPGLRFSVRGSGAHLNRAQELQEALMLRQTFLEDPLVLSDLTHLHELDSAVLTAARKPNPSVFIGEKPEPGTSVPQAMAAAMPPAPPEPEPVPPPVDNSPKISIPVPFAALPADAQAGLLEFIGLPAEGAARGESAPPDQMALAEMKIEGQERAAMAKAQAAPAPSAPNGNGSAPPVDNSPVGDGPEMMGGF